MNTILVWVLITVGGANGNQVVYSPPMADLESCQRLQKAAEEVRSTRNVSAQCVQIRVPK
jgi:hypothetical protein